jgi:hypothetical protein
LTGLTSTAGDA